MSGNTRHRQSYNLTHIDLLQPYSIGYEKVQRFVDRVYLRNNDFDLCLFTNISLSD